MDAFKKTEQEEYIFEGMTSLRALICKEGASPRKREIKRVLYSSGRKAKYPKEYAFLAHRAEEGMFELILSSKEEIDALSFGSTHGGVLAICGKRTYPGILSASVPPKGFFVMMEGIEDPYNFGYALRSLYAAGVDGVILEKPREGADGIVCRSSAGASERMDVYVDNPAKTAEFFRAAGYRVVCADQPNSIPVYEANLQKPLLLVIGGEKRGITKAVLERSDEIVRLVYGRDFDASLSAASAASILAFEVLRRNLEG